ncbi:hypothetical protein LUX39_28690 [Actinomadura madurae]|nr:hypothetical protein [Actinomadura madurae]MCQ0017264.1 hypothetical protein [Actinomadura madurae]
MARVGHREFVDHRGADGGDHLVHPVVEGAFTDGLRKCDVGSAVQDFQAVLVGGPVAFGQQEFPAGYAERGGGDARVEAQAVVGLLGRGEETARRRR